MSNSKVRLSLQYQVWSTMYQRAWIWLTKPAFQHGNNSIVVQCSTTRPWLNWRMGIGHNCQGVITYMSPVEVLATAIKMFDRQKVCLIDWLTIPFWLLIILFSGPKPKLQPHVLDPLILVAWRPPWSLDWPPIRALIAWFNSDPGHFYKVHTSDCGP